MFSVSVLPMGLRHTAAVEPKCRAENDNTRARQARNNRQTAPSLRQYDADPLVGRRTPRINGSNQVQDATQFDKANSVIPCGLTRGRNRSQTDESEHGVAAILHRWKKLANDRQNPRPHLPVERTQTPPSSLVASADKLHFYLNGNK